MWWPSVQYRYIHTHKIVISSNRFTSIDFFLISFCLFHSGLKHFYTKTKESNSEAMSGIKLTFVLAGADTSRHSGARIDFVVDNTKTATQLKEQIVREWPAGIPFFFIQKGEKTVKSNNSLFIFLPPPYYSQTMFSEYRDVGIERKKISLVHAGHLLDDSKSLQGLFAVPSHFAFL